MDEKKSLQAAYPQYFYIPILIVAASALFLTGIFMPVLTLKSLISKNTFSILSGIENLWIEKHYALVFTIFFFSIVFPAAKLLSLTWLWFARVTNHQRKKALFWLKVLGKWSMLDVFVVAVIIVAVKFGLMTKAEPRPGVYVFGSSILMSMLLTFWMDLLSHRHLK